MCERCGLPCGNIGRAGREPTHVLRRRTRRRTRGIWLTLVASPSKSLKSSIGPAKPTCGLHLADSAVVYAPCDTLPASPGLGHRTSPSVHEIHFRSGTEVEQDRVRAIVAPTATVSSPTGECHLPRAPGALSDPEVPDFLRPWGHERDVARSVDRHRGRRTAAQRGDEARQALEIGPRAARRGPDQRDSYLRAVQADQIRGHTGEHHEVPTPVRNRLGDVRQRDPASRSRPAPAGDELVIQGVTPGGAWYVGGVRSTAGMKPVSRSCRPYRGRQRRGLLGRVGHQRLGARRRDGVPGRRLRGAGGVSMIPAFRGVAGGGGSRGGSSVAGSIAACSSADSSSTLGSRFFGSNASARHQDVDDRRGTPSGRSASSTCSSAWRRFL